ncbi:MAG TPA: FHA domain-containing protein, partial [Planctomycetota bacterium]|nr:FHA domain-containing protein [Planctomycetota bacterium]
MKCPVCGVEAAEGQGLCPSCGTALDRTMAYDPDVMRARLAQFGKTSALSESGKTAVDWFDGADAAAGAGGAATPAPARPREEIAARCLLSSILADPIRLEEGTFYRVGRDKTSDICFPSTHVSRVHAELTFEKGSWVVGDLGSKNGT